MTKDYYKILGITEFETAENIKSAYHKLARKFHPDIAGNSSDALSKFKEINEAYEILSNTIKKEEYDRARNFYNYAKNNNEKINPNTNRENETEKKVKKEFRFNWTDFLSGKKSERSYKSEKKVSPKRGNDIYSEIEISVFEAVCGITKTISMLQTQVCPKCNGKKFVNGSVCKYCNGKGEKTQYKKFTVKIPQGIKDGAKIRLAGEGEKGANGGANGDLYLTLHIIEPQNYKTDGLNILKVIPITPYEAVLGTNLKISTLRGNVIIKIAPRTQNGQKIRLAGCGISQNNKIGDMIVTVEIKIPQNLCSEEIELYEQLEKLSKSNIRENLYEN